VISDHIIVNKNHLKKAIAFFGFCGIQYAGPKLDAFPHHLIKRQGSFRSKKNYVHVVGTLNLLLCEYERQLSAA